MDFKTMVKSRSSNGVVVTRVENSENMRNKKSLSSAGFQPPAVVKKRGVYVEKKTQFAAYTQGENDIQIQKNPPRRPRPGQKKFLSSVLTILSKSTTGTQCPDERDPGNDKRTSRYKQQSIKTDSQSKITQKAKKTKYKSRILNDQMCKIENEQLIILQPKKEIPDSPSLINSCKLKTSDGMKITENNQHKRTVRDILENNIYSGAADGVPKEVLEGKAKREKKLRIIEDPITVASEIEKNDDKSMYNFFVDLLETTFNVNNVKTNFGSDNSKTSLEIDESIARKLEINKNKVPFENVKSAKESFEVIENLPVDINTSELKQIPLTKPRVKAKSFIKYNSATVKPTPKSKSFENNKKSIMNKRKILKLFKEELGKDIDMFDFNEPECLYDALKVMAKNKRRSEKSMQFFDKMNNTHENSECMFERRKVISFGSKINKVSDDKTKLRAENKHRLHKNCSEPRYFPSEHSLEVYGYDYEDTKYKNVGNNNDKIVHLNHTSATTSDSNFGD